VIRNDYDRAAHRRLITACMYRISTSTYLLITTCRLVRAVNVQRQYSYRRFKYSNVQFVTVTTTHYAFPASPLAHAWRRPWMYII